MKKPTILRVFLLVFVAFVSTYSVHAQWDTISLPRKNGFFEISTHQGVLYGTAYFLGGVFTSHDGGENWTRTWNDTRRFAINRYNNHFYRIDWPNVLFRSTDEGANWTLLDTIPIEAGQNPLLTFSSDSVFCYARDLLYRLDQDTIWTPLFTSVNENFPACVVRGKYIWLMGDLIAHYSTDGGATWTFPFVGGTITGLTASGDTVLLRHYVPGGGSQVFSRSTDFGATWQTDDTHPFIAKLYNDSNPYLASDDAGNWYTSYNGLSDWDTIWTKVGGYPAKDVAISGGQVFVATENGILHHSGNKWHYGNYNNYTDGESLSLPAFLNYHDGYLFYQNSDNAAFSSDNGAHWQRMLSTVLPFPLFKAGNYFVGLRDFKFFRCPADDQFDWRERTITPGFYQPEHLVQTNDKLYTMTQCCSPNLVFRSSDVGETLWTETGIMPPANLFLGLNGLLLTRGDSSLLASADEGATWTVRHQFDFPIDINVSRLYTVNGRIVVSQATKREIYVSEDEGFTFKTLNNVPPSASGPFMLRAHNNTILLNIGDGFLYASDDAGENWKKLPLPYTNFPLASTPYLLMNYLTASDSMIFIPDPSRGIAWRLQFSKLVQLHGRVFVDLNGDGIQDAGENGLPNVVVRAEKSRSFGVSDASGDYTIFINRDQDTLEVATSFVHFAAAPAFRPVQASDTLSALDFALQPTAVVADVSVRLTAATPFRPGFGNTLVAVLTNKGAIPVSGELRVAIDPNLQVLSSNPVFSGQSGDTLLWQFINLPPLQSIDYQIGVTTDVIDVGTILHLLAEALVNQDVEPGDNTFSFGPTVVGSFDPNDKTVTPKVILPAVALNGTTLTYTIRFQNTGNFATEFVVLRDTLAARLDPGSLRILAASHPCAWKILEGRILEFRFDPLALPPAQDDEPGSHGFVQFNVNTKPGALLGETVKNTAHIFFDFNPPIATNTAQTRVQATLAADGPQNRQFALRIFPNPAGHSTWVDLKNLNGQPFNLLIFNQSGSLVYRTKGAHLPGDLLRLDVSAYPAGEYPVWVESKGQRAAGILSVVR